MYLRSSTKVLAAHWLSNSTHISYFQEGFYSIQSLLFSLEDIVQSYCIEYHPVRQAVPYRIQFMKYSSCIFKAKFEKYVGNQILNSTILAHRVSSFMLFRGPRCYVMIVSKVDLSKLSCS